MKTEIGLEDYFHQITNIKNRVLFSKIRLSNHKLKTEEGRYNKVPKEQRHCPFCPNYVEDEIHFLTQCPVYHNQREHLMLETLGESDKQQVDEESLFVFFNDIIEENDNVTNNNGISNMEFVLHNL